MAKAGAARCKKLPAGTSKEELVAAHKYKMRVKKQGTQYSQHHAGYLVANHGWEKV